MIALQLPGLRLRLQTSVNSKLNYTAAQGTINDELFNILLYLPISCDATSIKQVLSKINLIIVIIEEDKKVKIE